MPEIVPGLSYTDNGGGQYTFTNTTGLSPQVEMGYSYVIPRQWVSGLQTLGMSLATGSIGQPTWSWLQSYAPAQAVPYSGSAYVYAQDYALTNQAEVDNHSFEVISGHGIDGLGGAINDAWPDVILRDFLVTNSSSVGWSAGRLAPMTPLKNYVRARQLWLSVAMAEQKPARDWLQGLADICNSEWTWQGGQLDLVPRGDESITSAYGTFTPVITPVFDLVHAEGGDLLEAVEIEPVVNEDAHNIIKIEWTNRANAYAIEVMTASDQAHIELFGQRPASVVPMHAIHTAAVASSVAQQMLQREMTVWNKYRFKVPFSRALMGLMDLVTLTDADSALDRVPVRIISRSESGTLEYTYEAEDAPIGSATAPLYGTQAGSGFAHDYNAAPGPVAAPNIFEAPTELTLSGLEVYAAVSGQAGTAGQHWGGCTVYVSLDGLVYKSQGRLYGGARYGQLTAPMTTSGNASVTLAGRGGQLLSGSAEDAAALSTLCWADGPQGGEYFSYQTASLTAPNAYTLSGLVRGAYRNPIAAHTSGAAFVRVDNALAKSGALTIDMVGQKIYFKFTSFNVYGGGEQALSDAAEYSYTITGGQLNLPPPDVMSFSINADGIASWSAVEAVDLAGYQIRWQPGVNYSWGNATPLHEGVLTSSPYAILVRPAGVTTFMIKALDTSPSAAQPLGNESINAAASVINLGSPIVANVVTTFDYKALGFPGVITNATISGGNLVADADASPLAWDANENTAGWTLDSDPGWTTATYKPVTYLTDVFVVLPADEGAQLTLDHAITGTASLIEYRRDGDTPGWTADAEPGWITDSTPAWATAPWQPWPGQLTASAGRYEWRVTIQSRDVRGAISQLEAVLDVQDQFETVGLVSVLAAGTLVPTAKTWRAITGVGLTLVADGGTARNTRVEDPVSSRMITTRDASNIAVNGTVLATLQGY